jgi:hypothetical protein
MELIDTIRAQKRAYDEEKKCLETVVDLLSLNQIGVSGKFKGRESGVMTPPPPLPPIIENFRCSQATRADFMLFL